MSSKKEGVDNNRLPAQLPPEDILRQMVQNQSEELQLRQQENDRNRELDQKNFDFSVKALAAQSDDRRDQREKSISFFKIRALFFLFVLAAVLLFFAWALKLGKDGLVADMIGDAMYLLGGAFGGYGFGKIRGARDALEKEQARYYDKDS